MNISFCFILMLQFVYKGKGSLSKTAKQNNLWEINLNDEINNNNKIWNAEQILCLFPPSLLPFLSSLCLQAGLSFDSSFSLHVSLNVLSTFYIWYLSTFLTVKRGIHTCPPSVWHWWVHTWVSPSILHWMDVYACALPSFW